MAQKIRLERVSQFLRLIPPGTPGKARLARHLLGSDLDGTDFSVQDRLGCTLILPSLREPVAFYLFIDGVYETLTTHFLSEHLSEGDTFVDVGANIGAFSIPMAKRVGMRGRVLAVEPSAHLFHYLQDHVTLNSLANIRLKNCAAFDHSARSVPFYEPPVSHFGMGSCAAQFHDKPVSVCAKTLDSLLEEEGFHHVDVLKVDVEGCEANVFLGAQNILSRENAPVIVFEFVDWAESRFPDGYPGRAQEILKRYGYVIWRLPDFMKGRKPCRDVVVKGFEMLVARKG